MIVHVGGATDGAQQGRDAVGLERHTDEAGHPIHAQHDRRALLVTRIEINRSRENLAAGQ